MSSSSAAYYLSERGGSVTLIEQGDIVSGSSFANAGLIVTSPELRTWYAHGDTK